MVGINFHPVKGGWSL